MKQHSTRPRVNRAAKGRRLQNMVRDILISQGFLVEMASPRIVRYKDKKTGEMKIIATAHDIFKVWDGIFVHTKLSDSHRNPDSSSFVGERGFFQVTTIDNISARRKKILDSPFPCTSYDRLLGYVGGRGAHFRIFRGPSFEVGEETWPPLKKT